MYEAFENLHNTVKTETNSRLFLDDPDLKDGVFSRYVSYVSYGTMEVFTQKVIRAPRDEGGQAAMLPWYIENMKGEGGSSIGNIKVIGSPELMTTGVIRQNSPDHMYPATLEAAVFQVFEMPGYGILHNKAQVMITAIVDAIPPFDALCKCSGALLFDEQNRPRGMVAGRALTILPLD
jgi:hypothetical protein